MTFLYACRCLPRIKGHLIVTANSYSSHIRLSVKPEFPASMKSDKMTSCFDSDARLAPSAPGKEAFYRPSCRARPAFEAGQGRALNQQHIPDDHCCTKLRCLAGIWHWQIITAKVGVYPRSHADWGRAKTKGFLKYHLHPRGPKSKLSVHWVRRYFQKLNHLFSLCVCNRRSPLFKAVTHPEIWFQESAGATPI